MELERAKAQNHLKGTSDCVVDMMDSMASVLLIISTRTHSRAIYTMHILGWCQDCFRFFMGTGKNLEKFSYLSQRMIRIDLQYYQKLMENNRDVAPQPPNLTFY